MSILIDTTLRPIVFNKKDNKVMVEKRGDHYVIVKDQQVKKQSFDKYIHVLNIMAQFSRLIYWDSGIIREVIINPEFGKANNELVNNMITKITDTYVAERMENSNYKNSIDGRPMKSYVIKESEGKGKLLGTYISSPNDCTCMFLKGSDINLKCDFFQESDLIIVFKGSSTLNNFKDDLYSQVTGDNLSNFLTPLGLKMSSPFKKNNIVPGSFVHLITDIWNIISFFLNFYKPNNDQKQRVFITGHSLGGALSSIFTFILAEIKDTHFPYISSIHNITFGAPTILSDGARNTFNTHLDNGTVTLDRVVSVGIYSKIVDIIPSLPVGFSHPGFQPLKTELYPEAKTGRAYTYDTIRKVYQNGGFLSSYFAPEKAKYTLDTKIHMPNKIVVPAHISPSQKVPHSEYLNMTFISALRSKGMKNPGFVKDGKYYTFIGNLFDDGIQFNYIISTTVMAISPEPTGTGNLLDAASSMPQSVIQAVNAANVANTANVVKATNVQPKIGGKRKKHSTRNSKKHHSCITRKKVYYK